MKKCMLARVSILVLTPAIGAMPGRAHVLPLLGGNYSFVIFPGVTNNALEFPPTGLDTRTSSGLADLYVQPISLGWTTPRTDYIAGLGVFAPTGARSSLQGNTFVATLSLPIPSIPLQ